MNVIKCILLLVLISVGADCSNILAVFSSPSKSHAILGQALLKELAARGHKVTMLSPFPLETPVKNYADIHVQIDMDKKNSLTQQMNSDNVTIYQKYKIIVDAINSLGRITFEDNNVQQFLKRKPKFDLVIHNWFVNEALLGIGHAVNATTVAFSVTGGNPFLNTLTSIPSPYAYVPHAMVPFTGNMNFLQRVLNTIAYTGMGFVLRFINIPYQKRLLMEFFPEAPPLEELINDVDICLINSHVATEGPRPYLPNTIQIGGFHLHEKQTLPDDLKKYLDESKNGVIYFSLGTNVRSVDLAQDKLDVIIKTFRKLKYDVLWKFEAELSNLPKNVKISKWLPQRAVLEHKNLKAFITHGGLGGIVEAIYHGVPMIGIPFLGDQGKNVADAAVKGFAIHVDFRSLTEESFSSAIREITEDPKYKRNAVLRSNIYKNQEMNPMDRAVYWIEHVIKHKGAKHLKSRVDEISFYEYFLLDVVGFLALCVSIVVASFYALVYGVVKLINKCFKRNSSSRILNAQNEWQCIYNRDVLRELEQKLKQN